MVTEPLTILGAVIHRPLRAPVATAPAGTPEPLQLAVEVENPSDVPLHVWASRRAYDFDASTHVLTIYLTEHIPPLPPGIELISNHPRTPVLVVVNPKSRIKIKVQVPAVFRRRVAGTAQGKGFVEEPIKQIERVDLHIQHATEPIKSRVGESPAKFRERLRGHGSIARANVALGAESPQQEGEE